MSTDGRATDRIAVVADDLTGACDAAVAFAFAPRQTFVGLHFDDVPPTDWQCWAVNTGTRNSGPSQAFERTQHACRTAIGFGATHVIKKIDSLMRGNIADELRAAQSILQPRLIVLTPAFPALGRSVRHGRLSIHGCEEPFSIDERLLGWKCATLEVGSSGEISDRLRHAVESGIEVVLPNALNEADLQRLIQGAEGIDQLLWAGSGGLTRAMARIADGTSEPPPSSFANSGRPVLICVGSDHCATLAQVEHLKEHEQAVLLEARGDGYVRATRALNDKHNVVLLVDRELIDAGISDDLADLIHGGHCRALVLTGGDTALHVLDILGAHSIHLSSEILPGIPLGRIVGGAADGLAVATKSGAFGEPDALSRCLEQLRNPIRIQSCEEAIP